MKVLFNRETTLDLLQRFSELDVLSTLINESLKGKDFGLDLCIISFHCLNPKYFPEMQQFYTGYLIHKKFIAKKKYLECRIRIKYEDVLTEPSTRACIIKAIKGAENEINEMRIPNLNVSDLVDEIVTILESNKMEINILDEVQLSIKQEKKDEIPTDKMMKSSDFWELIDQSQKEMFVSGKITLLSTKLSSLNIDELYGFELKLRHLLSISNNYNVLALAKVILGAVSTDSFLYFRCRLILLGRIFFEKAIKNPDDWDCFIEEKFLGESLLTVSDIVFHKSHGSKSFVESPSEYALDFIDFDSPFLEMSGEKWNEEDLPRKFPKLWKHFSNPN